MDKDKLDLKIKSNHLPFYQGTSSRNPGKIIIFQKTRNVQILTVLDWTGLKCFNINQLTKTFLSSIKFIVFNSKINKIIISQF